MNITSFLFLIFIIKIGYEEIYFYPVLSKLQCNLCCKSSRRLRSPVWSGLYSFHCLLLSRPKCTCYTYATPDRTPHLWVTCLRCWLQVWIKSCRKTKERESEQPDLHRFTKDTVCAVRHASDSDTLSLFAKTLFCNRWVAGSILTPSNSVVSLIKTLHPPYLLATVGGPSGAAAWQPCFCLINQLEPILI